MILSAYASTLEAPLKKIPPSNIRNINGREKRRKTVSHAMADLSEFWPGLEENIELDVKTWGKKRNHSQYI